MRFIVYKDLDLVVLFRTIWFPVFAQRDSPERHNKTFTIHVNYYPASIPTCTYSQQ